MNINLSKEQEIELGQNVIDVFNLKLNKKTGRVETSWGSKTVQGIGAVAARLVSQITWKENIEK